MGAEGCQNYGAVDFLPKISNRTEEQAEKLLELPIVQLENLPE